MKNNVFVILVFINLFVLSVSGFVVAGCYHDMMIMRRINESLQQSIAEIQQNQNDIRKDMRVMKTNNEIVFELVINKEWKE